MRNICIRKPITADLNKVQENDRAETSVLGAPSRSIVIPLAFLMAFGIGATTGTLYGCTHGNQASKNAAASHVELTPSLKSENFEITGITATGRSSNGDITAQMQLKIKATSEYKTVQMIAITTGGKRIVVEAQGNAGGSGMALGGSRGTGSSGSGKTWIKNTAATPITVEIPKYLFAEGASEPVVVQVEIEFWKPGGGTSSEKGTMELDLRFGS